MRLRPGDGGQPELRSRDGIDLIRKLLHDPAVGRDGAVVPQALVTGGKVQQ